MNHLALEVFDLPTAEVPNPTTSQYAVLPDDTSITITDTSEIFASGDAWSHSFRLNVYVNAGIFGSAGDLHGSRLHEQINKRRARLWVEGLPLFLGYLKLGEEADVDSDGNVDVAFESGQKTFDEMIDGTSAQEVSVGDVEIGVALNRMRVVNMPKITEYQIRIDGLEAYAVKYPEIGGCDKCTFYYHPDVAQQKTAYVQRWPKLVKSRGIIFDSAGSIVGVKDDYTNIQTAYDGTPVHSFCNINICYPLKVINQAGDEVSGRGYTMRLARGEYSTDGGDNETRYNNAPNFYLLYWLDRLFHDMGIHIAENQAMEVEDLRRVFLLNYGCFYEEIEDVDDYPKSGQHTTPQDKLERYGQFYIPLIREEDSFADLGLSKIIGSPKCASMLIPNDDVVGKVLLRNTKIATFSGRTVTIGSVEGKVVSYKKDKEEDKPSLDLNGIENGKGIYSAYRAYATGENYPDVDISEIIDAMKSMFGIRLLFDDDYKTVRIVLLRNIFNDMEVQNIVCDIEDADKKTENSIRGFRMTYGKGKDDTNYYYKGFADKLPHQKEIWADTSDKHDYTQWDLNATYDEVRQSTSAFNKKCYVTPVNGNAYGIKVDEDEDVLFPTAFEVAAFMDAEDGDCTGEDETISEVQAGASPVIMNDVNGTYASLFSGEMKAPTPPLSSGVLYKDNKENPAFGQKIATYGRVETDKAVSIPGYYFSIPFVDPEELPEQFTISGQMDLFLSEGFQIRMEDNYSISNGGTPFDEADPGLQFGIMRSSGSDAYIASANDTIENEDPLNDYWEVVPGSGAIDHPDTCDNYGAQWDYADVTKVVITNASEAASALTQLFPNSNAAFSNANGYISGFGLVGSIPDDEWNMHTFLVVKSRSQGGGVDYGQDYIPSWVEKSVSDVLAMDAAGPRIIVEVGSSKERGDTLLELCKRAYDSNYHPSEPIVLDNGVASKFGRFSLKLRAEKPNPFYDPKSDDPEKQKRYLTITNENLRQRGLCDQFYKEYSYWVRNARIANRTVHMELAQLLAIDKTKRVRVGDVMGFIRKMQYSVSNETGLGMVEMEIMYI